MNKPSKNYRFVPIVKIRSQSNRHNQLESENLSENESDHSLPDMLSIEEMIEFGNGHSLNHERNYDRNRIEQ